MARRLRSLYRWSGEPGDSVERVGWIAEARLRAWEYHADRILAEYDSGEFTDTVRVWTTPRADLRVPEQLLIGDQERFGEEEGL
jgi:hypothetical protein